MYRGFEQRYRLRLTDFDEHQRLMPSAILDLFTDIATVQAEYMNMGLDDVRRMGLMWAVIREKFEVLEQSVPHQEVMVATWPYAPSRFSFMRDYTICDLAGNVLVKCTSEWVLMDFKERSFASVKEAYKGPTDFREDRCFERKARKLHDFEAPDEGQIVVPTWTDVDVNGHVNNAKYANYVFGCAPLTENESVRSLQIDFRKEVMCGEPVRLQLLREGDTLHAKGLGADGEILFACEAVIAQ